MESRWYMPVTTSPTRAWRRPATGTSPGKICDTPNSSVAPTFSSTTRNTLIGWGHSSVEYVVNLGRFAQVKKVALTHHDPLRDDDAIDRMVANIQAKLRENKSSLDVVAAVEGQVVEELAERSLGV